MALKTSKLLSQTSAELKKRQQDIQKVVDIVPEVRKLIDGITGVRELVATVFAEVETKIDLVLDHTQSLYLSLNVMVQVSSC